MNGWIKSQTSDKYLRPIREQMIGMLSEQDRVIDLGCGTGDFLIRAHSKIKYGLGVDGSDLIIKHAQKSAKTLKVCNIEFKNLFVDHNFLPSNDFTVVTASLFFHVIPHEVSLQVLRSSAKYVDQLILCGFVPPQNVSQKLLMWFDQRFTSHYRQYIEYCQNGYMEGLLKKCQLTIKSITDTFDPTIKIYTIKS
ncbi:MAG: class I SAM-dependent methyltransferase [Ekhidna sp.]